MIPRVPNRATRTNPLSYGQNNSSAETAEGMRAFGARHGRALTRNFRYRRPITLSAFTLPTKI